MPGGGASGRSGFTDGGAEARRDASAGPKRRAGGRPRRGAGPRPARRSRGAAESADRRAAQTRRGASVLGRGARTSRALETRNARPGTASGEGAGGTRVHVIVPMETRTGLDPLCARGGMESSRRVRNTGPARCIRHVRAVRGTRPVTLPRRPGTVPGTVGVDIPRRNGASKGRPQYVYAETASMTRRVSVHSRDGQKPLQGTHR